MVSLESLAVGLGKRSKEILKIDDERQEVVVYGAIMLLNICISILAVIFLGLIFGVLCEAILFSLVVSILRKYSGGIHASSPGKCAFFGAIISVGAGLIINHLIYGIDITIVMSFSILFLVISFLIIYKYAPVDSINKPITDVKLRKQFKANSMIIIGLALIIEIGLLLVYLFYSDVFYIKTIECISIGIMFQSLTLTRKK